MKYLLHHFIMIWLLSLMACTNTSTETTEASSQPQQKSSNLVFKVDYGEVQFEEKQSLIAFEKLFDASSTINLANITILNNQQELYTFHQGLGDVVLTKNADGQYSILEHYILPIGNVYGKVALLRYTLDVAKGEVKRDVDFEPQLHVYKYWYNHIVKEYDSYLNNESYTSDNWDNVPHAAFDVMRFLMFNLTLAAIEGCEECESRMMRITKDYGFVQSAEYSQNLLVCQTILQKFKD